MFQPVEAAIKTKSRTSGEELKSVVQRYLYICVQKFGDENYDCSAALPPFDRLVNCRKFLYILF